MKPYTPDASCPKCGHDKISTVYCTDCWAHDDSGVSLHRDIEEETEHLDRTCQRCSYQWAEAVMKETP